eukprot:7660969-Alexandrium_andersonii.AAC.1
MRARRKHGWLCDIGAHTLKSAHTNGTACKPHTRGAHPPEALMEARRIDVAPASLVQTDEQLDERGDDGS